MREVSSVLGDIPRQFTHSRKDTAKVRERVQSFCAELRVLCGDVIGCSMSDEAAEVFVVRTARVLRSFMKPITTVHEGSEEIVAPAPDPDLIGPASSAYMFELANCLSAISTYVEPEEEH